MKKYIILTIISLLVLTLAIGGCSKTESSQNLNESSKMTYSEAKNIAQKSCNSTLTGSWFYNPNSETYWFDMSLKKQGCSPACVVFAGNGSVEINWRCTGLIMPSSSPTTDENAANLTQKQAIEKASAFIKKSSTYVFDGSDLIYIEDESIQYKCPGCWKLIFRFTSSHGGYGDRTGQMLTQAFVTHKVTIDIDEGTITSATIDGKWDMIADKVLQ